MTAAAIEHSTILVCDQGGIILRVIQDGLGMVQDFAPPQTLTGLVDPGSFKQGLSFLVALKEQGATAGWELNAPVAGQIASLSFAGVMADGNLLVCISRPGAGVRTHIGLTTLQTEPDSTVYDEISRLNNDLINLQRELAKKNVELEKLNVRLERDNRALKQAEAEIRQQRNQLRGLATRLAEVKEIERKHLAKELHDQICQNLAGIALGLELLKIKAKQEPLDQLLNRLADVSVLVGQTGDTARDLMEGLGPTALGRYGLLGGLRQLGSRFTQRTGIEVEVQGEEAEPRLKPEVELAFFSIAQEALNNVAEHARASRVVITEKVEQTTVSLIIADNGKGLDLNLVTQPNLGRGWGLMIMQERAMAIAGTCRIESEPGQGTRVIVAVNR
jgi:signal transduction histidine kinase